MFQIVIIIKNNELHITLDEGFELGAVKFEWMA